MTDLSAIADTIERLVERELRNLENQDALTGTDIRSVEILSKTLTQCIERRKSNTAGNPLEDSSDEDLESDF